MIAPRPPGKRLVTERSAMTADQTDSSSKWLALSFGIVIACLLVFALQPIATNLRQGNFYDDGFYYLG